MPFKKGRGGRAMRAMREREPKIVEGDKRLLVLRGPNTSDVVVSAMKDLVRVPRRVPPRPPAVSRNDVDLSSPPHPSCRRC